jgi:hypothetical protein
MGQKNGLDGGKTHPGKQLYQRMRCKEMDNIKINLRETGCKDVNYSDCLTTGSHDMCQ